MHKRGSALAVALAAVGCTSMRTVQPQEFIPEHQPPVVSVWTAPDDVTIVGDPKMAGDTLKGVVFDAPWTVPLKDVVRVEVRAPDARRTALLVAGSAVSVLGAVLLTSGGHGGSMGVPCDLSLGPCNGVQTAAP